jgi:hypothetical protein
MRRAGAFLCAVLCCVLFVLILSAASATAAGTGAVAFSGSMDAKMSFSHLLSEWMGALADPDTYTAWMHMGGFVDFLWNETFLSAFSSSTFSSLSRSTILGTIPNIFFVVCILCALLSVTIAVIEIRKWDTQRRVVKRRRI